MKKAMEDAGLKRHLIIQPLGFHIPERNHLGFTGIDEFPFGRYYHLVTTYYYLVTSAFTAFQVCLELH